jgi:hypothetical protein
MAYMDISGLYQKYGLEQTTTQAGGEFKTFGDDREIQIKINLATLTTTDTIVTGTDNIFMPVGMMIEAVDLLMETAGAGGGTLDVGFVRTDRTTPIAAQGLLAAVANTATNTAGLRTTYTKGSTGAGTLIGATTANVGYITAKYTTTAFSAGTAVLRIRYRRP